MASIQVLNRKSGKKYRVQFMKNGKRIGKVFDKKKEAEIFLSHLTVNDDLSESLTNSILTSKTLETAINEFESQYSGKDSSINQRLDYWVRTLGDKPLGKVSRQDVKKALSELVNSRTDKVPAPATMNRYKAALSAVYTYMADEYDIEHNPARKVKQQKENNARCRYLNDQEREQLLIAAKSSYWDRLYLLVLLGLTTGARRGDLISLRWSDINFIAKTASVAITKNGEPRILPLTNEVLNELELYREVGQGFIFPNPLNNEKYFKYFDCHWRTALKESGITNFKFHDLRHTAASYLAMANVQMGQIADILGHRTLDVTKRYIHLSTGHKANVINSVMGGIS